MLFSLVIFSWGLLFYQVFSTAVMSVVFAWSEYICIYIDIYACIPKPNCRHHFYKCLWTIMCTTSVFKRLCALPWRGTAAAVEGLSNSSPWFLHHTCLVCTVTEKKKKSIKKSGTIYVLVSALAAPVWHQYHSVPGRKLWCHGCTPVLVNFMVNRGQ